MYSGKNRQGLKKIRIVIDIINFLASVLVVGLAVYIFMNVKERMNYFPYVFYAGAAVNFITGLKYFMFNKKGYSIATFIFGILLVVAGRWTTAVIGGF